MTAGTELVELWDVELREELLEPEVPDDATEAWLEEVPPDDAKVEWPLDDDTLDCDWPPPLPPPPPPLLPDEQPTTTPTIAIGIRFRMQTLIKSVVLS